MERHCKYIGFVGCYTKEGQADPFESRGGVPHDRSKVGTGVLAIAVDATGKLSFLNDGEPIIKADKLPNPAYLCILERSDNSNRPPALRNGGLCVVSELEEGKFMSYALSRDQTQGGITIHAKPVGEPLDTGGSYPCHIISSAVGSDMESVIICNYGEKEGVLSVFGFGKGDERPDAAYTRQICITFGPGSKADPDRQQTSHAHSTSTVPPLSPSSSMDLCCADLGSDAIVVFSMNTRTIPDGSVSLQCIEKNKASCSTGQWTPVTHVQPSF